VVLWSPLKLTASLPLASLSDVFLSVMVHAGLLLKAFSEFRLNILNLDGVRYKINDMRRVRCAMKREEKKKANHSEKAFK
jgi:hypothetical protein